MDASVTEPLLRHHLVVNNDDDDDDEVTSECHRTLDYGSAGNTDPRQLYPVLADSSYEIAPLRSRPVTPCPTADDNLVKPNPEVSAQFKVYKRRWYILALYSLLAATQSGVWNTFSPISSTAEEALKWDDATIVLLGNWGPIAYVVVGIVFSWMLDVKGLRISCLVTALLIAVGTGVRCITMDPPAVTWLMHIGQFLNGLAGPVSSAAPPYLSAIWFAPHERTTATAVGFLFSSLGMAVMFVLGPAIVPDVPPRSSNPSNTSTVHTPRFFKPQDSGYISSNFSGTLQPWYDADPDPSRAQRIPKEKHALLVYMYIVAGWCVGLFLVMLIYFPSKPPVPPSASACIQRSNFLVGLKHLATRGQFWLVCAIYGIALGVLGAWNGVLDVILKPLGIQQKEAGWIGFYGQCGGALASLLVAKFADVFTRILKWLTIFFYVIGTASLLVFTLIACDVIPFSTALVYASNIIGTTALNAAVPLIFELVCELAYPTGEGTTNGILTTIYNLVSVVFFLIFFIQNIGSMWANWTLVGSSGFCIVLLFLLKEKYNRLDIDESKPIIDAINTEIIIPEPDI